MVTFYCYFKTTKYTIHFKTRTLRLLRLTLSSSATRRTISTSLCLMEQLTDVGWDILFWNNIPSPIYTNSISYKTYNIVTAWHFHILHGSIAHCNLNFTPFLNTFKENFQSDAVFTYVKIRVFGCKYQNLIKRSIAYNGFLVNHFHWTKSIWGLCEWNPWVNFKINCKSKKVSGEGVLSTTWSKLNKCESKCKGEGRVRVLQARWCNSLPNSPRYHWSRVITYNQSANQRTPGVVVDVRQRPPRDWRPACMCTLQLNWSTSQSHSLHCSSSI